MLMMDFKDVKALWGKKPGVKCRKKKAFHKIGEWTFAPCYMIL